MCIMETKQKFILDPSVIKDDDKFVLTNVSSTGVRETLLCLKNSNAHACYSVIIRAIKYSFNSYVLNEWLTVIIILVFSNVFERAML